ncbi:hypothetical protein OG21DRAFT_1497599 [Imleria badia]|nr:hypothetical protein OG21DRAFT_1497599 [Imleria badia]
MDVLEAARKYSLDVIETKARKAIVSPKFLGLVPLRCFAIAHRGRLREQTLLAAKSTLTQPLIPSWFQEVELINATDLLSLLTYHKKCADAVYALRLDLSWMKSHYGSSEGCSWLTGQQLCARELDFEDDYYGNRGNRGNEYYTGDCGCPRANSPRFTLFGGSLKWWEDFMEETFTALQDKPCRETVKASAEKTVQTVKARDCQACSPKVSEGMRDFLELFAGKIEETVSQIEVELSF